VGVFHPGPRAAAGTRIRSGDTLGSVDVLGVPQEVVSPVDGIVGETLVEAGTAVEYGQELVQIELATSAEAR
jgi:acetyl-CoA carboxylase biotin carboxyl carrier protein